MHRICHLCSCRFFTVITAWNNVVVVGIVGLAIGNGVYFAANSAYSIRGYSKPDSAGNKYIYQARVLTGKSTQGQSGLKEPPQGYDSVGDGSSIFVVFYDAQTYPEYLITFK